MRFPALLLLRCAVLPALAGLGAGAWAADCVAQHGGDLLLTASDHCLGQVRRDPALRRQLVQAVDLGAAAVPSGHTTTAAAGGPARANLTHPLARLSQLNAQSRYLWSLGNPAPTYYGQTQAVVR
jgi:hypothetical protein